MGGIGDVYNAFLPSLTLGCGCYGRNSVSGNVSAVNLINIKRIGRRNNNLQWFKVPPKIYFEPNAIRYLVDMPDVHRVTIVTDATMTRLGFVDRIIDVLRRRHQPVAAADHRQRRARSRRWTTVERGAELMRAFQPDTIIALGGGSPMDAAKVMWLLYEHPEVEFADMREKFFDIRKRAFTLPDARRASPARLHPHDVGHRRGDHPVRGDHRHDDRQEVPARRLRAHPERRDHRPGADRRHAGRRSPPTRGFDALTHATEAFVSVYANDFTDGLALHAIKLIFENLATSVNRRPGAADPPRRGRRCTTPATIAGMAFGNAFLGIVHAMAHTLGATFHLVARPHQRHAAAARHPLQRHRPDRS